MCSRRICFAWCVSLTFLGCSGDHSASGIEQDAQPELDASIGSEDGSAPDSSLDTSPDVPGKDAPSDSVADVPADTTQPPDDAPSRYPPYSALSPVTPSVAKNLQNIAAKNTTRNDHLFIKAGASGTVSKNLLYCFAGTSGSFYTVDFAGHDELTPTLDYFRSGDAAGTTPFDRDTLCAQNGKTASWALTGNPSPLEQEIAALNPRFALVNYGTNDMEMGSTYRSALFPFYENLSTLVDQLISQGIVPLLSGLGPRADKTDAGYWVPTYNAVTRGLAEDRQIPYLNMYQAFIGLPHLGLSADNLHGSVYAPSSGTMPCIFDTQGLQYGYNTRNLLTLMAFDKMRAVVVDKTLAPDAPTQPMLGNGSPAAPFVIDSIPFTHNADTSVSPHSAVNTWSCGSGQDESGPEWVYRFQLTKQTPVRIVVLDGTGVDVDIYLLGDTPSPSSCIERADKVIEKTLAAGIYHVVVDTFALSGKPAAGHYLFTMVACEDGDPDCK